MWPNQTAEWFGDGSLHRAGGADFDMYYFWQISGEPMCKLPECSHLLCVSRELLFICSDH